LDPTYEQVGRFGHPGRLVRFGIAVAAVMLLAAIAKPWPGEGPSGPSPTALSVAAPSHRNTMVAAVSATGAPTPSASRSDWDAAVCQSPDGWRVVADDVELGRSVRAWVVASAAYSFVPPLRSSIPITLVVSPGIRRLGFCAPSSIVGDGGIGWTATLWRQGSPASPTAWQQVASLTPSPGWFGAPADPLDQSLAGWAPGTYVLEARFQNSLTEAWLGLTIRSEK
jgi:hypothetical protein